MTGTREQAAGEQPAGRFEVWGVPGVPEVRPGDDLVEILVTALQEPGDAGDAPAAPLTDGDILVVTSKIVSKAEGRVQAGVDRDEAIDAESVRTVSEWSTPRGRTRVVETRHGFVMAAAGVDASNVESGTVVLLPTDPDASARRLRAGLRARLGVRVGVILTDTAGRVWRNGVVDMAIGAAGIAAVDDLRGSTDRYGNDLGVTVVAVADELAAATELVRTKLSGMPVAVVRGLPHLMLPDGAPDAGAAVLVRPSSEDRFRLGTPEAMRESVFTRRDTSSFTSEPVPASTVQRAVAGALTAPFPPATGAGEAVRGRPPVRFAILESEPARTGFAAAFDEAGRQDDSAGDPPGQGKLLRSAACVVVPCVERVEGHASAAGPETGEPTATTLALGAAVENLLIVLSADGLAGTWLFPTPALSAAAAHALGLPDGWVPVGAVAIGHPAEPPGERPRWPVAEFTITR